MRIISWNVNGIQSKVRQGSLGPLADRRPDAICIQEVRTESEPEVLDGYRHIWNHAERKGYSGTLTLTRRKPLSVVREMEIPEIDGEGRLVACEYEDLWLVNVYVPNSSGGLRRAALRRDWDAALADLLYELAARKPTVICGDFNVPLTTEDVYEGNGSRARMERDDFPTDEQSHLADLLENGFTDAFRLVHPDARDAFTWWDQRKRRREVNRGWRLDYFLVSDDLRACVRSCDHLTDVEGSDHCPVELVVAL